MERYDTWPRNENRKISNCVLQCQTQIPIPLYRTQESPIVTSSEWSALMRSILAPICEVSGDLDPSSMSMLALSKRILILWGMVTDSAQHWLDTIQALRKPGRVRSWMRINLTAARSDLDQDLLCCAQTCALIVAGHELVQHTSAYHQPFCFFAQLFSAACMVDDEVMCETNVAEQNWKLTQTAF